MPQLPHPPCRCCLEPVYSFWQPNPYTNGGKVYVHCTSRGCPLYYATRELSDWLTMDLRQWNGVQHQGWKYPHDLLEVA